eukprot:m.20810 g.20810  ORF g.20810 m.20810 type:complete len:103 (+) comp8628_c0_seq1:114-422(+)
MSSDLESRFKKAAWIIRHGPPVGDASNESKLSFYKYFKQATEGDNTGSKPWAIQLEASAKWNAWESLKGMSKEDAMKNYIGLLDKDDEKWEEHPKLKEYTEE